MSNPTASAIPSANHFITLDVLRGCAALTVVFWHWQHFFYVGTHLGHLDHFRLPFWPAMAIFYQRGYEAVNLFFSISGFIFYRLYSEKIASKEIPLRRFTVLRLSRLYPLALLTLLVVAARQLIALRISGEFFVYPANDGLHFLASLFMLSSDDAKHFAFNAPSWSLTIEVGLYCVFFTACRFIPIRPLTAMMLAMVGFFVFPYPDWALARGIGSFFVGGCMSYLYAVITRSRSRALIQSGWLCGFLLTTAMLMIGMARHIDLLHPAFLRDLQWALPGRVLDAVAWRAAPFWLAAIYFPALILTLALYDDVLAKFGARVSFLGEISYSSYLIHFPLQLACFIGVTSLSIDHDIYYSTQFMMSFFIILIFLSLLSFRRFELPMQRYLRGRFA